MSRFKPALLLIGLAGLPLFATPAAAQSDDDGKGFYAVGRVGANFNAEQKLEDNIDTFQDKTKYKAGFTGELGAGYNFGMFRLEQTAGYTSISLNRDKAEANGFTADGKAKMLTVSINGYVDIPVSRMIVPYIGGGIGVARVDANLGRTDDITGSTSSFSGKDWGMLVHGDVGVGIHVAPKITVEVGGRYSRVSKLRFNGQSDGVLTSYSPTLSTISATAGVRYQF